MKKSIYLLMTFLGLALTGCEPMEDIHEEVDARIEARSNSGVIEEYVLTEEDYTADVEEGGLGLRYPNFSSVEEAGALIPQLLSNRFPVLEGGSLANVTFDLYAPLRVEEYTVTGSDYEAIGLSDDYFAGFAEIEEFLEYQFPQVAEGTFVELTYNTLANEIAYTITNDNFDLIEDALGDTYPDPTSSAGNYNNFDRREGRDAYWSNEMILEAINVVLSDEFADVEGQTYNVSYSVYDGSAGTQSMTVRFDGNSYVLSGGTAYDVSNADFDLIGEEFAETYPTPASSAAQYNNFDRREGNDAYWSEDMIEEALDFLLKENFPNAGEGARFDVTYRVYTGSSGTQVRSLVMTDGDFVIDENASVSTIEQTTAFAYANNNWVLPLTLQPEDYTAMGQRYPNFDNEDEAVYKLETFLELQFPYAEEGAIVPIAYDFYSGSTNTRYANFQFENGEFTYIPSLIQQTLQFGHNGNEWEPDNTIVYTMTEADFALVGVAFADEYVDPAWSAGNYSNFDRREGNRNYWSDDMLLEAINVVLDNLDPNAEEGQQYVVYFEVYTGSAGTQSLSVIKVDGEWVLNE